MLINTRLLALCTAHDSVAADTEKLEAAAEVYRDLLSSVRRGAVVFPWHTSRRFSEQLGVTDNWHAAGRPATAALQVRIAFLLELTLPLVSRWCRRCCCCCLALFIPRHRSAALKRLTPRWSSWPRRARSTPPSCRSAPRRMARHETQT